MSKSCKQKSSVAEIRDRFDAQVEKFSNLDTGQVTTIDASLVMNLIAEAAIQCSKSITNVLDLGCGAGNNTIKLRSLYQIDFDVTLVDLSPKMLTRANLRVSEINAGSIETICGDIRELKLTSSKFDVVIAAAVFHHLRGEHEWRSMFSKCFHSLRPGGSIWISDLITHEINVVDGLMWKRYGDYLTGLKGESFRDEVFDYIDAEDSPRSVLFQLDLLKEVGFRKVDILHKNSCFAAFGAIK